MASSEAILNLLSQVLDEFGTRLNIHGESSVLVSDAAIAQALHQATEPVRTPFGPRITLASQTQPDTASIQNIPNTNALAADSLKMDHYTHAVFGVQAEDPKYILAGLKHTIHALQPKGYAIVIAVKQETKQAESGAFQVSLEDKMKYQSKGRINDLSDVLYYAGFERGRVRSLRKTTTVDGEEVAAEVLLAMKWDQLTG